LAGPGPQPAIRLGCESRSGFPDPARDARNMVDGSYAAASGDNNNNHPEV
jgi:hypothetical protein